MLNIISCIVIWMEMKSADWWLRVCHRLMYFANWTEGTIEMAGMDGFSRQTLVMGGLQRPRSLTLDFQAQSGSGFQARQLYWLESSGRESSVLKACSLQNKWGSKCNTLMLLHLHRAEFKICCMYAKFSLLPLLCVELLRGLGDPKHMKYGIRLNTNSLESDLCLLLNSNSRYYEYIIENK